MLYIIGAGGHAKVIRAAAWRNERAARFISEQATFEESISEALFLEKATEFLTADSGLICGIGSIGPTTLRREVLARYQNWSETFHNVVHPSAQLDPDIDLGRGIFIAQGCQVVRGSNIADHAILNTGVIVDHDTSIGIGTHVGPGSVICGSVKCGNWVHVGSGSVIIQGCQIADGVVLGAGTVVNQDIREPGSTWVGTPARRIR
jgi:UDP-perosamine 4-acetyltransferase